ncbi:MAG TPA: cytochrome c [Candidatus Binataceae bacterium]|nr:cytochrome c [Candidatus Binataceae bacterium]
MNAAPHTARSLAALVGGCFAVLAIAGAAHASGAGRASGAAIYSVHCAVCHQGKGQGVALAFPALADTVGRYLHAPDGREYLVRVVSFGLSGEISSNGVDYDGVMQSWTQLSDAEIAAVLNHVLTHFNARTVPADFKPYTAAEVRRIRTARRSFDQVRAERAGILKSLGASATAPRAIKAH